MISQVIHDLALEQENIAKEKGQEDDNFPGKRWLRRVNKLNVTESTLSSSLYFHIGMSYSTCS